MTVTSIDKKERQQEFEQNLEVHENLDHVIFSPSKRIYLDYRNISREGYKPNEVHLYGLKEDKIIDARILECVNDKNCYFDRAYFLDNDVFVVHEMSLANQDDLCQKKLLVLIGRKRNYRQAPEIARWEQQKMIE